LNNPLLNLHNYLTDLEQFLPGRFYEIIDIRVYEKIIIEESNPIPKIQEGTDIV
jgi:hypothetical protein